MRHAIIYALLLPGPAGAQIFADFSTSLGDFTCELNSEASPRTVANFVGLAEGSRPWLDHRTGAVRTGAPFYNETIVHRVIGSTLLQAGTRSGAGDDGPGWVFRDEFGNGLTHNAAYVLSMANSGPNSNGSQFFITTAALPSLNGLHTVFGKVAVGQAVVAAIANVAAVNEKPATEVRIHSVTVRRVGAPAAAFDVHAHGLPLVEGAAGSLQVEKNRSSSYLYGGAPDGRAWMRVWRGSDLMSWIPLIDEFVGDGGTLPSAWALDGAAAPRAFYHLSVTRVPDALAPADYRNRTIELDFAPYDRWIYSLGPDGTTGTLAVIPYPPTETQPVTLPTTLVSRITGPFRIELTFDTPQAPFAAEVPGYIRIVGDLLDHREGFVTGRQTTLSGTEFGWAGFDAGSLSVSE